jgi:hypothetical protein
MNCRGLEGSGQSLIEELFRHLPGQTDKNLEELQSGEPVTRPRFELKTSRIQGTNCKDTVTI